MTLVAGATGKIGRALVAALLDLGHQVLAMGTREETVAALLAEHEEAARSGLLRGAAFDLGREDAAEAVTAWLDRIDAHPTGLVHAARSLAHLKVDDDGRITRGHFLGELTLSVVAPYELTFALAARSGSRLSSVVNLSSMYGLVTPAPALYEGSLKTSPINYGTAKAAMIHLTRELAVRLAPDVRVNAVSFGGVAGRADEAFQKRYAALCPAGRMMEENEVVGPVLFLLGEGAAGMTGANLVADGGWTLW
ncbi:MAG: SDR family oxidoreductase [Proteobacteria bacterium]|nr:SDR family oxidoreductase [Pseudomonadota bacterium]